MGRHPSKFVEVMTETQKARYEKDLKKRSDYYNRNKLIISIRRYKKLLEEETNAVKRLFIEMKIEEREKQLISDEEKNE
jgi:hypothetical protein